MQIWRLGSVSSQGCIGAPAILWWWGPGRIDIGGGPRHPRLALLPFPSEINFDEFGCYEHIFIDIPSYLPELFGNFKAFWFTVRLRGKAVRLWVGIPNLESHDQTVRIGRSVHDVYYNRCKCIKFNCSLEFVVQHEQVNKWIHFSIEIF